MLMIKPTTRRQEQKMINEIFISCPCCGEKLKIQYDSNGFPVVFLLCEESLSQSDLLKHGIELGVEEGGEI